MGLKLENMGVELTKCGYEISPYLQNFLRNCDKNGGRIIQVHIFLSTYLQSWNDVIHFISLNNVYLLVLSKAKRQTLPKIPLSYYEIGV